MCRLVCRLVCWLVCRRGGRLGGRLNASRLLSVHRLSYRARGAGSSKARRVCSRSAFLTTLVCSVVRCCTVSQCYPGGTNCRPGDRLLCWNASRLLSVHRLSCRARGAGSSKVRSVRSRFAFLTTLFCSAILDVGV